MDTSGVCGVETRAMSLGGIAKRKRGVSSILV